MYENSMIQAVIFDMDWLLIDSESLWQEAECAIFGAHGIPLTTKMCIQTKGMRIDEVVAYWAARYPGVITDATAVEEEIMRVMIDYVRQRGVAMPGVYDVLTLLQSENVPMAIASSSYAVLIDAVVERLAIAPYFTVTHSAEHEKHGKPHPAVFLRTAQKLAVAPSACLVFEDSLHGMIAAKAAQMTCVGVPDVSVKDNPKIHIADVILPSLTAFDHAQWTALRA